MERTRKSSVLETLAARYERSRAGRTGRAVQDVTIDYEKLLRLAGCDRGEPRICAERDLEDAHGRELLIVERNRRTNLPLLVRFSHENESRLFGELGRVSPTATRNAFAAVFVEAADDPVPDRWLSSWAAFCRESVEAAAAGEAIASLSRDNLDEAREILKLMPRLLAWETDSLRRFASCRLCGDSKRLETLKARIESILGRITNGAVATLEDLGIMENERSVILQGPLCLRFPHGALDLRLLAAPARIDRRDLKRATLEPSASRCLTVENLTVLHELAKGNSTVILASSGSVGGFAHSAIIEFLQALPAYVELSHCGDADPKGFEILNNLRERTGRPIASLGMVFDGSWVGPALNGDDRKDIARLLAAPSLTRFEKDQLAAMLSAGHKGRFEQESRPLPRGE